VGASSLLETLHRAGFASLRRSADHYGLGLALGNGDVTLLELANAYRSLANGGVWRPYRWRAVPRGAPAAGDGGGSAPERRVMSAPAAALVLDILSDAAARVPGFGLETPFDFPFPVAVKTGTSRHFTDNWAVGTTEGFTVAVWAGNFSGRPMDGVSGVTGAGPLLHRAVMLTAARYAPGALTTPEQAGAVPVAVCRLSGLLATPDCAPMTEWFIPGSEPARADDWQRAGRVTLPAEYAAWAAEQAASDDGAHADGGAARLGSVQAAAAPPSPARAPGAEPRFRIVSPQDGDRYQVPPGVEARYATVALRAAGDGADAARWFIDGRATRATRVSLAQLAKGMHSIRAQSTSGRADEVRIVVE
jgi:penicillin-binding protein 1C